MPVYVFHCPECGQQFEVLRPFSRADEPAVCAQGHTVTRKVLTRYSTTGPAGNTPSTPPAPKARTRLSGNAS